MIIVEGFDELENAERNGNVILVIMILTVNNFNLCSMMLFASCQPEYGHQIPTSKQSKLYPCLSISQYPQQEEQFDGNDPSSGKQTSKIKQWSYIQQSFVLTGHEHSLKMKGHPLK